MLTRSELERLYPTRFYLVFGQRVNARRVRIPGWLCTNTFIAIVIRLGWGTLAITETP